MRSAANKVDDALCMVLGSGVVKAWTLIPANSARHGSIAKH